MSIFHVYLQLASNITIFLKAPADGKCPTASPHMMPLRSALPRAANLRWNCPGENRGAGENHGVEPCDSNHHELGYNMI